MKETRVFKSKKNTNKSETPLGTSNSSQINQASHSDSNFQSNTSDTKQSPKEHIVPPVINPILKNNADKESANNKTVSLKEDSSINENTEPVNNPILKNNTDNESTTNKTVSLEEDISTNENIKPVNNPILKDNTDNKSTINKTTILKEEPPLEGSISSIKSSKEPFLQENNNPLILKENFSPEAPATDNNSVVVKEEKPTTETNPSQQEISDVSPTVSITLTPSLKHILTIYTSLRYTEQETEIISKILEKRHHLKFNNCFKNGKYVKPPKFSGYPKEKIINRFLKSPEFRKQYNEEIENFPGHKELKQFKIELSKTKVQNEKEDKIIFIPEFLYSDFNKYKSMMEKDIKNYREIDSLNRYIVKNKKGRTRFEEDELLDEQIREMKQNDFSGYLEEVGNTLKEEYKNQIEHFLSKEDCVDKLISENMDTNHIIDDINDEFISEYYARGVDFEFDEVFDDPEYHKQVFFILSEKYEETLNPEIVFNALTFDKTGRLNTVLTQRLVDNLKNKYPGLKELCFRDKNFQNYITQICKKRTKKIINYLDDYFSPEHNLELLESNDFYQFRMNEINKEEQRKEEKKEDILSRIPEHYKDSFPLARKVHRLFTIHVGPTNSGKTYEAIEELKKASSGIYLAPLRLLAYEQYENLNSCNIKCNMVTGEEKILVSGAKIQASTIEMLSLSTHYEVAVIDEAQMVSDSARGGAWCTALYGVNADVVHVCVAPEGEEIVRNIIEDCGDSYTVVKHKRLTPLRFTKSNYDLSCDVKPGDALIVFSRRSVHAVASQLRKSGYKVSVIYGSLPYDVRHREAAKFASGENTVVVATDAIGMGMNLPIKRIVFLEDSKFDGTSVRHLYPSEIKQIAGRAGRFGKYPVGLVASNFSQFIQPALKQNVPSITYAMINFPESLVGVEGDLSETISIWASIPDEKVIHKADVSEMIEKAEWCEQYTDDKELIYTFLKFPFDYEDMVVRGLWEELFMSVLQGKFVNVGKKTKNIVFDKDSLDSLEVDYRYCDLLYNYCDKYQPEDCEYVLTVKKDISEAILEALEKRGFNEKRCKRCGRVLEWDYPYGICEKCYRANRSYRRYNYDYDFDEGDYELDIDEF